MNQTIFMPHHCVLNPKKLDRVRAVFDFEQFKVVFINGNLFKGLDLLNSYNINSFLFGTICCNGWHKADGPATTGQGN